MSRAPRLVAALLVALAAGAAPADAPAAAAGHGAAVHKKKKRARATSSAKQGARSGEGRAAQGASGPAGAARPWAQPVQPAGAGALRSSASQRLGPTVRQAASPAARSSSSAAPSAGRSVGTAPTLRPSSSAGAGSARPSPAPTAPTIASGAAATGASAGASPATGSAAPRLGSSATRSRTTSTPALRPSGSGLRGSSAAASSARPKLRVQAPASLSASRRAALDVRAGRAVHLSPAHAIPYSGGRFRPLHRTADHRYARPVPYHLRPAPHAYRPPPRPVYYRPRYARWWVHPYWRHLHASVRVVWFGFAVYPWEVAWVPPPRPGWVWVPGHWAYGYWWPGWWLPVTAPPIVVVYETHTVVRYVDEAAEDTGWIDEADCDGCLERPTYVWVPGWWNGDVYVEGFWRISERSDGDWVWVDGHYEDDGTYVPGTWIPARPPPEGYVWEPGYFDGESWVEGFWRPEENPGYRWVPAYWDEAGVHHDGYWEPLEDRPGQVWVPGWFDGNQWVRGYWVDEEEYATADPENWEPPEGWNAGWGDGEVEEVTVAPGGDEGERVVEIPADEEASGPRAPLALPIAPPEPEG